ncbi:MAG: efflux RND transporter periplasmic adaptor subunit, partial [Bacteroidales bacterium]
MKNNYLLFILVAISIFFYGCTKKEKREIELPIPVSVITVSESPDAAHQSYVGVIEPDFTSDISFAVPGNVERVYYSEGDCVAKGALLAEVNSKTLQDTYTAAAATLRQAQDGYERMKQLHNKGSITEVEWIDIQTKLEKAKAIESIAKKNLEESKLYAPFSGVIGKRLIEIGINVLPGVPVFTLLAIEKVNIKVSIPEDVISQIKIGQKVSIRVAAIGNKKFEGVIAKKGMEANKMAHSYEITIPIANQNKELMPGMICDVQINTNGVSQFIVVPNQSIKLLDNGEKYVWIVKDSLAHKQSIITGALSGNGIVVNEGLSDGDQVIVKGHQKVCEG